jgi:hypothetical protein
MNRHRTKLKNPYGPTWVRLTTLLMLVGLFLAAGCRTGAEPYSVVNTATLPDPDQVALDIANQALQTGDYKKALEGFEMLEHSANEKIARKASYGRACAHLSSAETASEIRDALVLWQSWSNRAPSDLESEDPRLLMPLLRSKLLAKERQTGTVQKRPTRRAKKYESIIKEKEKEIERLSNLVEHMESEIQTLSKSHTVYVAEMEKEIQALKDKIKSLEAIDQQMKEKKKEVSTQ